LLRRRSAALSGPEFRCPWVLYRRCRGGATMGNCPVSRPSTHAERMHHQIPRSSIKLSGNTSSCLAQAPLPLIVDIVCISFARKTSA
jgi:hypothetical protein